MPELHFAPVADFPRGTLAALLQSAYTFEPRYAAKDRALWRQTDDFYAQHPAIAATCAFVTVAESAPAGFIGWDPRGLPQSVKLGYNCVAAPYQGQGVGTAQLREALRRIALLGPCRVLVTTDETLAPAQRMYQRVGFAPVRRWQEPRRGFAAAHIDYALEMNGRS